MRHTGDRLLWQERTAPPKTNRGSSTSRPDQVSKRALPLRSGQNVKVVASQLIGDVKVEGHVFPDVLVEVDSRCDLGED